jgi:hypothetical protein
VSDQVSVVAVGVLLGLAALIPLRPRILANEERLVVRNILGSQTFAWNEIHSVSFPDGAPWARVELDSDEYHPVLAIQAMDRQLAVDTMRELRKLQRAAAA